MILLHADLYQRSQGFSSLTAEIVSFNSFSDTDKQISDRVAAQVSVCLCVSTDWRNES